MDSFDEICFRPKYHNVTFDYDFKEEMVKASENSAEYNRVTVSLTKKAHR